MFNIFFSENRFVYEIKWEKYVRPDMGHMIIQYNTAQALCMLIR
jgi:hypothetical protein